MKNTLSLRNKIKASIDMVDNATLEVIHRIIEAYEPNPLDNINSEDMDKLNQSLKQAAKGEVIPHASVKNEYKKWLSK